MIQEYKTSGAIAGLAVVVMNILGGCAGNAVREEQDLTDIAAESAETGPEVKLIRDSVPNPGFDMSTPDDLEKLLDQKIEKTGLDNYPYYIFVKDEFRTEKLRLFGEKDGKIVLLDYPVDSNSSMISAEFIRHNGVDYAVINEMWGMVYNSKVLDLKTGEIVIDKIVSAIGVSPQSFDDNSPLYFFAIDDPRSLVNVYDTEGNVFRVKFASGFTGPTTLRNRRIDFIPNGKGYYNQIVEIREYDLKTGKSYFTKQENDSGKIVQETSFELGSCLVK